MSFADHLSSDFDTAQSAQEKLWTQDRIQAELGENLANALARLQSVLGVLAITREQVSFLFHGHPAMPVQNFVERGVASFDTPFTSSEKRFLGRLQSRLKAQVKVPSGTRVVFPVFRNNYRPPKFRLSGSFQDFFS